MTPDRFFALMLLLASSDAVTTQELASALGVSLRTITRDLNWLRDAGLPVSANRGRLGGVTMLPGSGPDLTRLTPGERDHLSLTGLDEKQRAELNVSVESQRALSKIVATQPRRVHELLPLTDVVHVDSRPWHQARAFGTTPASLIDAVRRGRRLRILLPLLYLHGLSSGYFVPATEQFLGGSAGLSPATVTRLTAQWQADHAAFQERDLSATDYANVWVDGIHLRIRLDEAKATVLAILGVRADGTKELVAMAAGYRESSESWAALLRDCARRGKHAPVLAVADGALGFWTALREVFPHTREQKCWVHKTANVLDSMPKSAQPAAKKAIQDIYNAEDHEHAEQAIKTFAKLYGTKFPKAVKKITDDQDVLLKLFDFPAEHWIHLRTTNPIESTFATVRLRTKVTRGAGSHAAALAMFKLVKSAQARWRAGNGAHLVPLVRAGARFEHGQLVEHPKAVAA